MHRGQFQSSGLRRSTTHYPGNFLQRYLSK
jgi:hypothetical protein